MSLRKDRKVLGCSKRKAQTNVTVLKNPRHYFRCCQCLFYFDLCLLSPHHRTTLLFSNAPHMNLRTTPSLPSRLFPPCLHPSLCIYISLTATLNLFFTHALLYHTNIHTHTPYSQVEISPPLKTRCAQQKPPTSDALTQSQPPIIAQHIGTVNPVLPLPLPLPLPLRHPHPPPHSFLLVHHLPLHLPPIAAVRAPTSGAAPAAPLPPQNPQRFIT